MEPLTDFRNPNAVRELAKDIAQLRLEKSIRLMEVCGGHTAAIYRFALHDLLPPTVQLLSGPGCPVCVTSNDFVDRAIALSFLPDTTIATFGDLIRVPGSTRSLANARAQGADVRVFYSSADALNWTETHPERRVVFLGIGFETTACTLAATIAEAIRNKVENFFLLSALKTMPEALRALFTSPDVQVNGLILPGHVTTVAGMDAFEFIAREFSIPCVVSGFEPVDLMETILMLCRQILEHRSSVENQYHRVVRKQGNPRAQELILEMLEPCDMPWRGFGVIPRSGLRLRSIHSQWDAENIQVEVEPPREDSACQCGDVLRGRIRPNECPLFGKVCTPDTPHGACMVSAEGACAAVYHFSPVNHGR
jgi:hydrogenase expression/formation protein HypD